MRIVLKEQLRLYDNAVDLYLNNFVIQKFNEFNNLVLLTDVEFVVIFIYMQLCNKILQNCNKLIKMFYQQMSIVMKQETPN